MEALRQESCKAARALMNWTAMDLATEAGVSIDTLRSFESGRSKTLSRENEAAIRKAFQENGVKFLATGDVSTGEGVAIDRDKD